MTKTTFHLIANAHLDPVWLWDWREGLNEGITTVRTVLDLMDERPDFTFIRGEAIIYQHIEKTDPPTFARIKERVKEGRWDIVGGTYIQPDTNLPATEVLARHFLHAQTYFQSRFGQRPRVAWAADSFGHCAGLPEILAKAGMTGFAFTRPIEKDLPLPNPAFWWESPGGSRVLAYRPVTGWYGSERDEIFRRLDAYLELAVKFPTQNVGCFYGVGNHGGGPTRRQLDDIEHWIQKHPDVEVIHSGLHRFFDALAAEEKSASKEGFPVHRGELNFCLRGCYSAMAKFKFPYRRAEAELVRAEKTDAILAAKLKGKTQDLTLAWESVLFNSFHDILPGSSIERAYDDQLSWLGRARHDAQRAEFVALNALAQQLDTSVAKPQGDHPTRVPFLVWNPHPHEYAGPVELEASLDYRPLMPYAKRVDQVPVELIGPAGEQLPFQVIRNEHCAVTDLPWRKRVVFQAKLPPLGWSVFQLGWAQGKTAAPSISAVEALGPDTIGNDSYRIVARLGTEAVQIFHDGKPLFDGEGLSVIKVEDPWGSWGGMEEEKESLDLSTVLERWKIAQVEILESGPERAALWVRFAGTQSRLDLTFFLNRNRPAVDVDARVFWNERSSRLKMEFPVKGDAQFEVPGAVVTRGAIGEVPGGRWVKIGDRIGFASNALYNFDSTPDTFRATIVRASRYANDVKTAPQEEPWRPAVDTGELTFRFVLTAELSILPRLARELEEPLVAQMVSPHPGPLGRSGSLFALGPENVQLVALKAAGDGRGWVARLQETSGKAASIQGDWLGQRLNFGEVLPWSLNTFRIVPTKSEYVVETTNIIEK
jgi:alpha-mannosidase